MLEAKVEDFLVKRVKALGGEVRKVKWVGRKSAPDRLVMLPRRVAMPLSYVWQPDTTLETGDRCTLITGVQHPLVELKRPGEVPRPDQLREHEKLRAAGFIVLVLDSIEAVEKAFPEAAAR